MSAVFRAYSLTKRYGATLVLNGLDFEVPEGSVYGLIGANGAGKTTTLKIMMNILQPTSGTAELLGVNSRRIGPKDLERIGYVSENQEMPLWMTVQQLLRYLQPFYPTWDDVRAAELVRGFELPADRKLKDLSRGMLMKAAFAASLAYRPRILVLDEPFTGLDPLVREELIAGLLESASETSILISSHDLAEIESFASHIGYLENGWLRFSEEMASLASRFREIEVTLDGTGEFPNTGEWPATWLRREANRTLARFVDSQYDPERTTGEIARVFGETAPVSAHGMPLRSIFITLAKQKERPQ